MSQMAPNVPSNVSTQKDQSAGPWKEAWRSLEKIKLH